MHHALRSPSAVRPYRKRTATKPSHTIPRSSCKYTAAEARGFLSSSHSSSTAIAASIPSPCERCMHCCAGSRGHPPIGKQRHHHPLPAPGYLRKHDVPMACAHAGAGGSARDAMPQDAVVGTGHLGCPTPASLTLSSPIRVGIFPTAFSHILR